MPVSRLCLGEMNDLTSEGDLGIQVMAGLRERFHSHIAAEGQCAGLPSMEGRIRLVGQTGAIAFDEQRQIGGHHQRMELELKLISPSGRVLWNSGFVEGRAIWLRGATLLDTRETQQRGRHMILDELIDDVAQRFLSLEPMKEIH